MTFVNASGDGQTGFCQREKIVVVHIDVSVFAKSLHGNTDAWAWSNQDVWLHRWNALLSCEVRAYKWFPDNLLEIPASSMDTPSFLLKIVHLLYHILDKMANIIGIIYGKMIFDQM